MEYTETVLTNLYSWCFPDTTSTVVGNCASSEDNTTSVEILQVTNPEEELIWAVSATDSATKVTSFDTDLANCIDTFKASWTNRNSN
jgi:hypothetical protein